MGEKMQNNKLMKYRPTQICDNIESVDLNDLKTKNIQGIFLDVDNTLFDDTLIITDEVDSWLKKAKDMGFKLCILSNTRSIKKVQNLRQRYDILGIHMAAKPKQKGFKIAQTLVGMDKEKLCIIGDQLFTDVLGGNKFGIMTILVKPISKKELIFTRMKRPFENMVLKKVMEK